MDWTGSKEDWDWLIARGQDSTVELRVWVPIGSRRGETGHATWWKLAAQKQDVPRQLAPLIFDETRDTVSMTRGEWNVVRDWCRLIPGWDNGRLYGRTPLVAEE